MIQKKRKFFSLCVHLPLLFSFLLPPPFAPPVDPSPLQLLDHVVGEPLDRGTHRDRVTARDSIL